MICKHCFMSIEPWPSNPRFYRATEGRGKGLIACLDAPSSCHEPDGVPTPTGVADILTEQVREAIDDLKQQFATSLGASLYRQEYPPGVDLHCKHCGELLRPHAGHRGWWCLASQSIGLGFASSKHPFQHRHEPINPPTKDTH